MGLKDIFRGREKADREMTENPYLNARKQWNFIMGDMVSSRLLWQWAGMTGLLIGLGGVGGMIYLGSQSKFIPYIVEVNKLGETVAVARADQPQATDERIVRAMLGSFIGNARTVTTDIALQRKYVLNTYAMLKGKLRPCWSSVTAKTPWSITGFTKTATSLTACLTKPS